MTISAASLLSSEFAVGQRYLSDTESELGLGVVIDVDDRCVHILFRKAKRRASMPKTLLRSRAWYSKSVIASLISRVITIPLPASMR